MADKKYIGSFRTEQEVLDKINELKLEGYVENDIYVVTNDKDSLSMVRGQTDVDLSTVEGNWLDKFMAFMSGDEPVRAAFLNMGFSDEESDRYYGEVKSGSILLYVDKEYGTIYDGNDRDLGANQTLTNFSTTDTFNDGQTQEERMRLHEERLSIDKEQQQAGEVNVEKHIVDSQERVEVPVEREEVYIERRAVDETAAGDIVDDGEKIHIPVMEERVEVTKRPVVSEEIVVGKKKVTDTELINETVRREEADIQRTDNVVDSADPTLANYNKNKALDNDPLEEKRLDNTPLNKRGRL
ncbi:YsnF/AvaK domain-containing protein [Psychrobacillus sp. INOP01]|uniref:YsnF/AvaK domain-containing protein n=1 Tax=Psychrobacillus sp. INOP01 TaxID=2829187 RepID=UPI001BA958C0|nr:YsnF/AvaK domain-containing protein [Psychrobacillus sp. INOP01]QUG40091.1 YsnF/AvaK domain-containing protein [Psychrobacillus sp. INOP01]